MEKMAQIFRLVEKHRIAVIVFFILISLLAMWQLQFLQINSDILSSLPKDDAVAQLYHEIGDEFGGNDLGMVVMHNTEIFEHGFLKQLADVTDSIAFIPGVGRVTSLINVVNIRGDSLGIEISPLIDRWNIPESQESLDRLKRYVLDNEMYRSSLVSADGRTTLIVFALQENADKSKVVKQVRSKLRNFNKAEVYFGGLPVLMYDVNHLIISDIKRLVPIVFGLILLILYLSFGSISLAFLPLISAGIAVLWSLGLMAAMHVELSVISDVIPVVLLAVGSAYSIHVINALVVDKSGAHSAPHEKLLAISVPVSLSSVTTVVGFISFIFGAYLTIIKEFGIFSAFGTLVAMASGLFFVPALYFQFPMLYRKRSPLTSKQPEQTKFLHHIARLVIKYPKQVVSLWLLVLIVCLIGYSHLRTSVNMTNYFRADFPSRVAEEILQQNFGGSMPIFLVFEGDIRSPELLKAIWEAEQFMKQDTHVLVTQSVASLIARMNEVMGEGKSIPDDHAKIDQLWFLLEGQEIMENLVNSEQTKGVIQSRFASIHTRDIISFTEKMNRYVDENTTKDLVLRFTGITPIYHKLNSSLVKSQVSSLLVAIGLVLLFVSIMFKSALKGVVATIPVLATSLMMPGLMGLFGFPLDVATVLVGSLALGIGIDYAIHISTAFERFRASGLAKQMALTEAIKQNGRAVAINVLSVGLGFSVLLLSELVPLQHFGALVAIGMMVAGLSSLSFLPAILLLTVKSKT